MKEEGAERQSVNRKHHQRAERRAPGAPIAVIICAMIALETPRTRRIRSWDPRTHRMRGWGLIVLGTLASIGIVALGLYFWTLISSETSDGLAWRGSYEFTIHTLELFADVFIFGVVAAVA